MGKVKYKGKIYEADIIEVYNSYINLTDSKGYYSQIILGGDDNSRFRVEGEINCHVLEVSNCLTFNGNITLCNVGNSLLCNGVIQNLHHGSLNYCNAKETIKQENERLKNFEKLYKLRRYNVVYLSGVFKDIKVPVFGEKSGGVSRSFLITLKGKVDIAKVGNCMTLTGGSIRNALVNNQCHCNKDAVKSMRSES